MKTKCRHFNGPVHNKECSAGVNYRTLVGGENIGWMARLCCVPESPLRKEPMAKCDKFDPYTKEEILEQEKEMQERFEHIQNAIGEIRKISKEKNINGGIIHCPKCGKPLHFNIAKLNGHIWAKCETKNCIQWMQ